MFIARNVKIKRIRFFNDSLLHILIYFIKFGFITRHSDIPILVSWASLQVASGSPRGQELNAIMERGALVPLDIVLELIKEAMINSLSVAKGFLIDGYPREKEQGIRFEEVVAPVHTILFFEAKQDTLVSRLLHRAKTSGRADDNEETIKKRLQTFITHTDQILEHYVDKMKKVCQTVL